jgi:hypothetical protein
MNRSESDARQFYPFTTLMGIGILKKACKYYVEEFAAGKVGSLKFYQLSMKNVETDKINVLAIGYI